MSEEITAKQAEQRYGLSGSYLIRRHKEGKFTARQIGPMWLFDVESLQQFVETRRRRGGYQGRKPKAEAFAHA